MKFIGKSFLTPNLSFSSLEFTFFLQPGRSISTLDPSEEKASAIFIICIGLATLLKKSEVDMIMGEITLVNDVTQSLGTNIKTDIRNMNNDIRHITEIVNDIEDRQKEDSRELLEELKIIEEDLDIKIQKSLSNPLANM